MSTERLSLTGPTMGTTWSVLCDDTPHDATRLQADLQAAVDLVDFQMSTWKPDSTLMRFNAVPCGEWITLPAALITVLAAGLATSTATQGAFEMNVGQAVQAWGFGAAEINLAAIQTASAAPRISAASALELDAGNNRARKSAPVSLDLSGIAKGYGVDRLAEVLTTHGITRALCAIDGELRALGSQGDGKPWAVSVEDPTSPTRAAHSVLGLADAAVATSGDYRHFVTVKCQRLSHTLHPQRMAPLVNAPASVTVIGQSCMLADAMATALMVMGADEGLAFAQTRGLSALFLLRKAGGVIERGTGLFTRP